MIHCTDLGDDCDNHDNDDNHGGDGDGCIGGGDGDDGGDDDDHVDGGGGDPLQGPLSVLGGDVRVDALVAKVRDDRPQERLRLLHVVERRRDVLKRKVKTALKGSVITASCCHYHDIGNQGHMVHLVAHHLVEVVHALGVECVEPALKYGFGHFCP